MLHLLQFVDPTTLGWVFSLSLVLAIAMGFATGANDVANTFGTSVGSGALTLKKALIAAAIFEMLGALALGSHVAGTLKSGIAIYSCFEREPNLYMIGMASALGAAAVWLIVASVAGLPVSATHSIVGGIVGMTMALKGASCVNWSMTGVGKIVLSWVTSPLLSSVAAFLLYTLMVRIVYFAAYSFERALWATPFLLASAVTFLAMLTFWDMAQQWWARVLILVVCPILIFSITVMVGIPYLRNTINTAFEDGTLAINHRNRLGGEEAAHLVSSDSTSQLIQSSDSTRQGEDSKSVPMIPMDNDAIVRLHRANESRRESHEQHESHLMSNDAEHVELDLDDTRRLNSPAEAEIESAVLPEDPEQLKATQVFWYLQNVTACFGSFAHGANDTANAIGPFSAVFHLWMNGTFNPTDKVPLWIVAIGGVSIVLGLAILGYRVIQTMGKDIIHIDYSSGFSSELSSSMTVVIASRLQIPVSSTHCQVGAIVGVGLVEDHHKKRQNSSLQRNEPNDPEIPANGSETHLNGSTSSKKSIREEVALRLAHVHWKSVGKIAISWLVTVPFSAAVAAIFASLLKLTMR